MPLRWKSRGWGPNEGLYWWGPGSFAGARRPLGGIADLRTAMQAGCKEFTAIVGMEWGDFFNSWAYDVPD